MKYFKIIILPFVVFLLKETHGHPLNRNESLPKKIKSKTHSPLLLLISYPCYFLDEIAEEIIPDHLNGLKMERDGHLNKDFHKEVFLGRQYVEFKKGEFENGDLKENLQDVFIQ